MIEKAASLTLTHNWLDQVCLRHLREEDLPALEWDGAYSHFRRIYREAYQASLSGQVLIWVAELPGVGIIGQAFVQLASPRPELADGEHRAYLYGFRVKPAYRNAGLGTHMLNTIINDLRARGYTWLNLNVAVENTAARRLYERLGFVVIGYDPGCWSYVDHEGQRRFVEEPAWRMQKQLL
ncbi:GNAT family N-acetyltransferase [uncultured Thermanaerothrix sp.]|uniref:GNAT family N-acetyltransferase n=1 Tax=uncultured Thermanaerothrix sp. TaxID=1195149 RepID=UPI00260AB3F8|nr:GNAT family N-acetyltransferase [uncultured Thermanaerothrix sp.]